MQQLVMFICAVEVLACLATGPQALALYAGWRGRRDFPRAIITR